MLRHQIGQKLALVEPVADLHLEGHGGIGLDRADTVDARHGSDDDHIVAFEQRAGGRVAHPVDLFVDRGFLLDIGVRARHIGFGLVVVIVGDEILDRIVRKEALELAIELRRKRLVRREDERRALRLLDHLGHGEGLARTRHAEKNLRAVLIFQPFRQIANGRRLVTGRLETSFHLDGDAAFGFFGPDRAMRRPEFAVLEQRIAGSDQVREGLNRRRRTGGLSPAASSRLMSRPATGLSPAAARSFAEAAPPMEVPRPVRDASLLRSGIFFGVLGPFGKPWRGALPPRHRFPSPSRRSSRKAACRKIQPVALHRSRQPCRANPGSVCLLRKPWSQYGISAGK